MSARSALWPDRATPRTIEQTPVSSLPSAQFFQRRFRLPHIEKRRQPAAIQSRYADRQHTVLQRDVRRDGIGRIRFIVATVIEDDPALFDVGQFARRRDGVVEIADAVDQMMLQRLRRGENAAIEQFVGRAVEARASLRDHLAEALRYLSNNACRMDYPRYRREDLPITSSLAESLVAEFNARVKSRKKFWTRPSGAEAMLQLRAALLSEDGGLERYFAERPGSPYRRKAQTA
jgi:hypothetical protein